MYKTEKHKKLEEFYRKLEIISLPAFWLASAGLIAVLITKWEINEPGEIYYVIGLLIFFSFCAVALTYNKLRRS